MERFSLRRIFSLFRRTEHEIAPVIEPANDPKVQAYLDYLRDHGPQAEYIAQEDEEPMLALPWAA